MILNEVDNQANNSVSDPYYGGLRGFDEVYEMLDKACEIISNKL